MSGESRGEASLRRMPNSGACAFDPSILGQPYEALHVSLLDFTFPHVDIFTFPHLALALDPGWRKGSDSRREFKLAPLRPVFRVREGQVGLTFPHPDVVLSGIFASHERACIDLQFKSWRQNFCGLQTVTAR